MYEIVERSMSTGAISQIYSGYRLEEDAEEWAEELQSKTDDYWYEARREMG